MPQRGSQSSPLPTARGSLDNALLLSGLGDKHLEFDSGHIREEFGPNRIVIGLRVFVRHENVVRLLEFLGYRQEE